MFPSTTTRKIPRYPQSVMSCIESGMVPGQASNKTYSGGVGRDGSSFYRSRAAWIRCVVGWDPETGEFLRVEGLEGFTRGGGGRASRRLAEKLHQAGFDEVVTISSAAPPGKSGTTCEGSNDWWGAWKDRLYSLMG